MDARFNELKDALGNVCAHEEKPAADKLVDKARDAYLHWNFACTDFLDPFFTTKITPLLKHIDDLSFFSFGGHKSAIRNALVFHQRDLPIESFDASKHFSALFVHLQHKTAKITHSDYLGAVMATGVERSFFGDLLVTNDGCVIIGKKSVIDWLSCGLHSVGSVSVTTEPIRFSNIQAPVQKTESVMASVASLRADCLIAAGFCMKREDARRAIASGRVFINYVPLDSAHKKIEPPCSIVCRGHGKLDFIACAGSSKRGRIKVQFSKIL